MEKFGSGINIPDLQHCDKRISGVFLSVLRTHLCNLYKEKFFFLSPEPNVSKREDNDPDCFDKIFTIKFKNSETS